MVKISKEHYIELGGIMVFFPFIWSQVPGINVTSATFGIPNVAYILAGFAMLLYGLRSGKKSG